MSKRCKQCGAEKPATLEHFGPCKANRDGLMGKCRECSRAYSAAWKKAAPAYGERRRELYAKKAGGRVRKRLPAAPPELRPLRRKAQAMASCARERGRAKGVPTEISALDVWELIKDQPPCPVCLSALSYTGNGTAQANSPSLDRIEPARGYVPGNVGILCQLCNSVKNGMTIDQIKRLHAYVCEAE